MKPSPGLWLPFRGPYRPEHTAGDPPLSSHTLKTSRRGKQQQGRGTRGGRARRQPWSHVAGSGEKWTRRNRDEVSVSEGFPSSVLLPQEANTCPPTARQHRHQPCLQVRATPLVSQSATASCGEQLISICVFCFTGSSLAQSKERLTLVGPSWIPGMQAGWGRPRPDNQTWLLSDSL